MYKIENCASKIDEAEVQHYTSEEGNRLDEGISISKGVFKSYYFKCTGSSRLMRISLLRISLLQFFKTFQNNS